MAEASSDLGAALARIAQLEDELRQSKQQVTPFSFYALLAGVTVACPLV